MNPILTAAAPMLSVTPVLSQTWKQTLDEARGQTVFFHAWGENQRTSDFIASVGEKVLERHCVTLQHVPIAAAADAVARVLAERAEFPCY